MRLRVSVLAVGVGVVWAALAPRVSTQAPGFPSLKNGDWFHYTADMHGSRYSPLDQINADNFNKLEVAWRFKTDNFGTFPEYKLEGTPLAIRGILYTTAGTRRDVNRMPRMRSEEHTSELQSLAYLVCRLLLEKKKKKRIYIIRRARHTVSFVTRRASLN